MPADTNTPAFVVDTPVQFALDAAMRAALERGLAQLNATFNAFSGNPTPSGADTIPVIGVTIGSAAAPRPLPGKDAATIDQPAPAWLSPDILGPDQLGFPMLPTGPLGATLAGAAPDTLPASISLGGGTTLTILDLPEITGNDR